MRVFMVPLVAGEHDRVALDSAGALARAVDGVLEALFVRPDPLETLSTLVEGASQEAIRAATRVSRESLEERIGRVRAALDAAARSAGLADDRVRLNEATGDVRTMVAAFGRVADLTVMAGAEINGGVRRAMFEAALLHSGRPVLLLPAAGLHARPARVAVAWNGSAEAARAVKAALPWLEQAEEVHLLGSGSPRLEPEAVGALARYLLAHGVATVSHDVPASGGIGAALLRQAEALGADCLVMGGYGRSRMQEMIFGGATRHVLGHVAMPVLLAH